MWVFDVSTFAILAVNDAAVARYGYSRNEFLQMTILDLRDPTDVAELVAARDAGWPRDWTKTVHRHRIKDGSFIAVEAIGRDIEFAGRPARLVSVTDVTERVRAEEARRESEAHYRLVTDGVPILISYVDRDERYRFVNRPYEQTLGRLRSRVIGRTVREIVGEAQYARVSPHIQEAFAGSSPSFASSIRGADGGMHAMEVRYVPHRNEQGDVVGFFALISNVTERVQLEEQLRHSQKLDAIGRLAGGIAHDFNNLLTVISANTEAVLRELPLNGDSYAELSDVLQAASRAAGLTRQLLAFGRKQVLQPAVLNVNRVVREAERMLQRVLGENVTLLTELDPKVPCVMADLGQVEQVLMNLVVNARDAMPHGGLITLSTGKISVTASHPLATRVPADEYVFLRVRDTGIGMDEATQAKIFEPFFTTKPVGKGTGLGLSTVYGIVQQSGGHVLVDSEIGLGSAFTVLLPGTPAETPNVMQAVVRPAMELRSETILLVEDEAPVRAVCRRALASEGYTVLEAGSAVAALALFEARGDVIAMLVTDLVMPEMGGRALHQLIRRRAPTMPTLFISGYSADRAGVAQGDAPNVAFLAKPFTSRELAAKVREMLEAAATRG